MSFSIRLAVQADCLAAAEVVRRVFDEYGFTWDAEDYNADLYDLEGHYLSHGHPFWVAELDSGTIVGTCGVEFFNRHPGRFGESVELEGKIRAAAADCSLERLYVDPRMRRLGLGTALWQTAIDEARSRGGSVMEIWSDKKLTKAHALYEKFGAIRIGERICDDPDRSPEWGMAYRL